MKRWQQLLSFYLVLCVAFAGAVGMSPVLHTWVEHGGRGHAHSHVGLQQVGGVASKHTHPHPHNLPESRAAARLSMPDHSPTLFGYHLSEVYRVIGNWIANAVEHLPESPESDQTGHTHHSLSQMLLSGSVEGVADVPPLVFAPTALTNSSQGSPASFFASDFEAQTASRAPPPCA